MLNCVLGRAVFFARKTSMLPSREPVSELLRVSGSANMTEPLLRLGDGGELLTGTVARMGRLRFSMPVAW